MGYYFDLSCGDLLGSFHKDVGVWRDAYHSSNCFLANLDWHQMSLLAQLSLFLTLWNWIHDCLWMTFQPCVPFVSPWPCRWILERHGSCRRLWSLARPNVHQLTIYSSHFCHHVWPPLQSPHLSWHSSFTAAPWYWLGSGPCFSIQERSVKYGEMSVPWWQLPIGLPHPLDYASKSTLECQSGQWCLLHPGPQSSVSPAPRSFRSDLTSDCSKASW